MKNSFKRAFAIGLACVMAGMGLAGCAGKNDSPSDDKTSTAAPTEASTAAPTAKPNGEESAKPVETESAATPEATAEPEERTVEIYRQDGISIGAYNNGIAHIEYEKVSRIISASGASDPVKERGSAYIDREGKVLFWIPEGFYGSAFSNGYAYVHGNATTYVIDESGKVLSKHSTDKNAKEYVISRGDGYVLTYEKASTFSASKFIYRIYDPTGEVVNTFESEEELELDYCGEGVFYTPSTYKLPHRYWDKNGHSFIDKNDSEGDNKWFDGLDAGVRFNEDKKAVVCGFIYSGSTGVVIMDTDGNTSLQGFPNGDNYKLIGNISEDHLLAYKGDLSRKDKNLAIVSIDTVKNTYNVMDKEYSSRVYAPIGHVIGTLSNGRYVFTLMGSDGEEYVGIFDSKLVPVCEPIRGTACVSYANYTDGYSDGRLIIFNGKECVAYDVDGNELFAIHEFRGSGGYQDGMISALRPSVVQSEIAEDGTIVTKEINTRHYLDLDGNLLFDQIDFTTGTELVLE